MRTHPLGRRGPEVAVLGLGCMALSGLYGPADDTESIATIHEAMDRGITVLDTGDFYGRGHNELLLRAALQGGRRERAFIQVKFGAQVDPGGAFIGFDARPKAVKSALAYTLTRLGTDYVDLYQPARLDPEVPIEETIGAVAELVEAGYVRHIGVSEMGAETIRRAHAVHPLTELQLEYSLMSRSIEASVLPTARELGLGVTVYGVLSRGLLAGQGTGPRRPGDIRQRFPRYQGGNLARNRALVEALAALAREQGATPAQLAYAWVLSRGDDLIPLIGARTRAQLRDILGALELTLSPEELARIEQTVPAEAVAGQRYDEHGMRSLDSER